MSFLNKVVLITGGSSGIGASTAILFSHQGANVAIVGRNETKLNSVAEKCAQKPLILKADVTIEEDVKQIIQETINAFGQIDVLINNAGMIRYSSIEDENILETYDEVMATNLRSVVNITNLAVPYLIQAKGNIVNISSISGENVAQTLLIYSISKAALNHFSKAIAMELADKGVRVNTISVGAVRTDVLTNAGNDTPWEVYEKASPLGKICEPEEIAELVLFLASDKGISVTGSNYVVDNGCLVAK